MPRVYFGPYGTQFKTAAEPAGGNCGLYELGSKLVLPDGREYRYALAGAVVRVAGNLYQSIVPLTEHSETVVDQVRAVDATALSSTLGAVAAAIDIYSEGYVSVNKVDGLGLGYRIRRAIAAGQAHAAVASTGIITVNLEPGEKNQVALVATSELSYSRNRFHSTIIHASPPTAMLAGVSPWAATASQYYYEQVEGLATVYAEGTLLAGKAVQASITTDGAVESAKVRVRTSATGAADVTAFVLLTDQDGANTTLAVGTIAASTTADITGGVAYNAPLVGICTKVAVTTEYAQVDLRFLN